MDSFTQMTLSSTFAKMVTNWTMEKVLKFLATPVVSGPMNFQFVDPTESQRLLLDVDVWSLNFH